MLDVNAAIDRLREVVGGPLRVREIAHPLDARDFWTEEWLAKILYAGKALVSRAALRAETRPAPPLRWLAVPLLLALLGCSSELTRDDAKALIEAHILQIAPDSFTADTLGIAIEEILQRDEFSREVRFLWGASEASIFFQRSDHGWTVARYGPSMTRSMSLLAGLSWRVRYDPLLTVLRAIDSVGFALKMDLYERANGVLATNRGDRREEFTRLFEVLESGPHEDQLRALVDSAAINIPPDLEWHYLPGSYSSVQSRLLNKAPMLWVVRADDPDVICATKLASSSFDPPGEFYSVDAYAENYCSSRGRVLLTSMSDVMDRAAATATENGILTPGQVKERTP